MTEPKDRLPPEEAGKRFRRLLSEVDKAEQDGGRLMTSFPAPSNVGQGLEDGSFKGAGQSAGDGKEPSSGIGEVPGEEPVGSAASKEPPPQPEEKRSGPEPIASNTGGNEPADLEDTHPTRLYSTSANQSPPSANRQESSGMTSLTPRYTQMPPIHSGSHNEVPLPRQVDEVDDDATQVSPSAYDSSMRTIPRKTSPEKGSGRSTSFPVTSGNPTRRANTIWDTAPQRPVQPTSRAVRTSYPGYYPPPPAAAPPRSFDLRWGFGCLLRMMVAALFALVLVALCGGSIIVYQYFTIARGLPDVSQLREKASKFETTRIMDRNGNVLYEILDPNAGKRTYVPLTRISPYLVAATIATEDRNFYSHPGFDLWAIFRAFWQNYQSGETVSGASTITQQLARTLLFEPDERGEQTYERKIREAVLAAEITRRYTKDEILELYLNEIYYGNLAYGVEAAAETYFGSTAGQLTLGQASFLAGLPQAPSVYDVYTNPDLTFKRHEDVLVLMYEASQQEGCIFVSNAPQRVCLDPVAASQAASEIRAFNFLSPDIQMRYPHWVQYIRYLLEAQYDPQTIYRSGFSVYTTLDPSLQDAAEKIIREQVDSLADRHVTDGALVAIRPATGEILAMVGSADFNNESISGQVNMAISPRQPGSAIKPLTYLAAFEKGWTPATLIWDVPSEFSPSGLEDPFSQPYVPVNYDERYHGPVTVRTALANSLNIPAVKTLDFVEIYDDPNTPGEDGLIPYARRLGISSLNRPDYGLSLTLGGGEVSLLELTDVYAALANGGRRLPPVAITRILDHAGNVVFQYQSPSGEQVIRPEHAYLISSILSDNQARIPMFGQNSVLNLPFQAAAKTGTTNDFRDNWTLGYTPDVAVGVWVGNADFTPMQDTTGLTGAAPAWAAFMQKAIQTITGGNPTPFSRPAGIVEYVICEISGTQPSEWCPAQRSEIFAADQPPLPKEQDLWQKVTIDTWTELKASPACSDFTDERFVLNITDPWAKKWLRQTEEGRRWAENIGFEDELTFTPERECKAEDPHPVLEFAGLREGERIEETFLDIYAQVDATDWFDVWTLEYGLGDDPVDWELLEQSRRPVPQADLIYTWDLEELPAGPVTLRLTVFSTEGTSAELTLRLNLQVPTPTPTQTPTETPTSTPTQTQVPTSTPTATQVPSPTPTTVPARPTEPPKPIPSPTTQAPILERPTETRGAP